MFVGCLSSSSTAAGHKATDKEGQSTHTHARTQAHTHTHTHMLCLSVAADQAEALKEVLGPGRGGEEDQDGPVGGEWDLLG